MAKSKIPLADRFWNKVDKNGPTVRSELGPCWVWTGATISKHKGYGVIFANGRNVTTHRASYELHNGPVPDGLCVLHRCDNPPCVRPFHLFAGTRDDNNKDMAQKERTSSPLTGAQVRDIRSQHASGVSMYRLSKAYGLHKKSIARIVTRETWAHIT